MRFIGNDDPRIRFNLVTRKQVSIHSWDRLWDLLESSCKVAEVAVPTAAADLSTLSLFLSLTRLCRPGCCSNWSGHRHRLAHAVGAQWWVVLQLIQVCSHCNWNFNWLFVCPLHFAALLLSASFISSAGATALLPRSRFSLALCRIGLIYLWGKEDYSRTTFRRILVCISEIRDRQTIPIPHPSFYKGTGIFRK